MNASKLSACESFLTNHYTLVIILIVHTILRLMMLVDLAIIMKRRLFLYHNSNQSGRIFPRQEIIHD